MKAAQKKFFAPKGHAYRQAGFTLIELLVVITIIATLAVTVFVALNPLQRLKDSRDARRTSDVDTVLTAVHAYIVDNKGVLPDSMGSLTADQDYQIGTAVAGSCTPALTTGGCTTNAAFKCVDLGADLTSYLKSIPVDPLGGTDNTADETGYGINISAANIVTIKACRTGAGSTEGTNDISASR